MRVKASLSLTFVFYEWLSFLKGQEFNSLCKNTLSIYESLSSIGIKNYVKFFNFSTLFFYL